MNDLRVTFKDSAIANAKEETNLSEKKKKRSLFNATFQVDGRGELQPQQQKIQIRQLVAQECILRLITISMRTFTQMPRL